MDEAEARRLSLMVDYLFGEGVAKALPSEGVKLVYSRRSGRVKLVFHHENLFATVRPNGSMALTLHGARILAKSPTFGENCVEVRDEAKDFVIGGKSVFCRFVVKAGKNVLPKGEAAVVDGGGRVLGVGTATMNGTFMTSFNSGVAVKVREGFHR